MEWCMRMAHWKSNGYKLLIIKKYSIMKNLFDIIMTTILRGIVLSISCDDGHCVPNKKKGGGNGHCY